MSISRRFILTFSGLTLGLFLVLLGIRLVEERAQIQEKDLFLTEQQAFLKHWLTADHRSLLEEAQSIARELSQNQSSEPFTPQIHDATSLIWELSAAGIITVHRPGILNPKKVSLFDSPAFLKGSLLPEGGWFYFHSNGAYYHASYAPVTSPEHRLLLIRELDSAFLQKLSLLMGASATLQPLTQADAPVSGSRYQVNHRLTDWRGQPLISIIVRGQYQTTDSTWIQSRTPLIAFLTFGVTIIIALYFCLHRWVILPMNHIRTSLIDEQITPIIPYLSRPDEIGRIARLIENTGAQREALRDSESELQRVLQERSRLSRDLHDGIIQSLYGTGMSLATVQARLPAGDTTNRASLDQSRASLNEAILDLRNFITGLEPEALKQPTFTAAVTGLMNSTETEQQVKTQCSIDENLARQLSITQRAHLLQITREALSNALRHGEATEVSAELLLNGSYAEYHFRDNGHGFKTSAVSTHNGHGLENLSNRARDLDASLSVRSHPGEGTQLKLMFKISRAITP